MREIVMIHDLRRRGLSKSAIARRTGLDCSATIKMRTRLILIDALQARTQSPRAFFFGRDPVHVRDTERFERKTRVVQPP